MSDKGHTKDTKALKTQTQGASFDSFVLEKTIFSNVFEKDIKRVYIYKKAERLAKAVHLVAPAFRQAPSLGERINRIAIALVDAAILPPQEARDLLARELLALSSVLSIARTGGHLSSMNADLIGKEAHSLLEEIAGYEEPRLVLEDGMTLAELARSMPTEKYGSEKPRTVETPRPLKDTKGHPQTPVSDKVEEPRKTDRREAILAVLRSKGPSFIKDISTVIRDVSEKTIQRELQQLVQDGEVTRTGERRWTTYALATS